MLMWARVKRKAKHTLAAAIGVPLVRLRVSEKSLRVLCFHDLIQDDHRFFDRASIHNCTVTQFRKYCRHLVSEGYQSWTLSDVCLGRDAMAAKAVALTFDDGYRSLLDMGVPLLETLRMPAGLFLSGGLVGRGPKYATWAEVRQLVGSGLVTIGSHGVNHRDLTAASDRELAYEVNASRELLQERIGTAVATFAYPYGRFDRRVRAAVQRAGYTRAFTTKPGTVHGGTDPWLTPRVPILLDDTLRTFTRKLAGAYDWL